VSADRRRAEAGRTRPAASSSSALSPTGLHHCDHCTGDENLIDIYKRAAIEKFRDAIRAALAW